MENYDKDELTILKFIKQAGITDEGQINYLMTHICPFIDTLTNIKARKRTEDMEKAYLRRTFGVVNLDNPENNCKVCGYDHEYMTEWNRNTYGVKHAINVISL